MLYKGARKPLPQIAAELGVAAVIEGSVQRQGSRIGINVQLIDGEADRHLWAQGYERDLKDILTLQREIASTIASAIRVTLTERDRQRLAQQRVVDPDAHLIAMKGFYALRQGPTVKDSVEHAMECFQASIARDSMSAFPWYGLSWAYTAIATIGYRPLRSSAGAATAAAAKAVELDPGLAEAHAVVASTKFWYEWNWKDAETEWRRAVELNPNSAPSLNGLSMMLSVIGKHEEAKRLILRAREVDPLNVATNVQVASRSMSAREYDRAIQECREVLKRFPDDIFAMWVLGNALTAMGRYDEAIQTFLARKVPTAGTNWMLGYAYGLAGRKVEARKVLAYLTEKSKKVFVAPAMIAVVHEGLGEYDRAMDLLEQAYEEHDTWLELLKVSFQFDQLRGNPRFESLLRKMNFP